MIPIYLISAHTTDGSKNRTFGWYPTDREADAAVSKDTGSMCECLYDWLVIERQGPGIHAMAEVVRWYRWDEKARGWLKSRTAPDWARGVCNFGGVG